MALIRREFWRDRPVLVTGHTGFKGGWLATWLLTLGARVSGYALAPDTTPSYFVSCGLAERFASRLGDVTDGAALEAALAAARPSVIFHLAAQSLVRRSYRAPVQTFATNVLGTTRLLEAVRRTPSVQAVVVVTSDKCYANHERPEGYREDEPLGGDDPYSASKAATELVTTAYRRSFFTAGARIATARAGNVIGGGDWSEDRLIPDVVRALARGYAVRLRNPSAVRPWQHVLEPLGGYLVLAERLVDSEGFATAFNFGPRDDDAVPVAALVELVLALWGEGRWEAEAEADAPHEAGLLRLDCRRAHERLGWQPVLTLKEAAELSVTWYRAAAAAASAAALFDLGREQIAWYEKRWQATRQP
ncbi:MAG TPA: CDP-glucose 4,6-dehydratase [Methylomirabilota bacterium]|nr:CDP-glucose 4,6-dehydratase [Methylomirabilota bacterium]